MDAAGKLLLGFFVGFLCGLTPLVYGIILRHKLIAFVGLAASAITGSIFSVIDKSPFTSMIMASIFVIFIYATNKRMSEQQQNDDEE